MLNKYHLNYLGEEIITIIKLRTRAGIDADGKKLPRKKGPGQPLKRTGRLLNSFKIKVGKEDITITNTAPYADIVSEDRPFVGLAPSDIRGLEKKVTYRIRKVEEDSNKFFERKFSAIKKSRKRGRKRK